jgi:recombination DNA repair RAD52 pathway protein
MPKTIEEVRAALAVHFPKEQLEDKNGFGYVPWDTAMRIANDIFGFENVTVTLVQPSKLEAVPNADGEMTYGYSAVVRVDVTISDSETGGYYHTHRDGQGFNELEFTSERTGRNGERIPPRAMIDAAIKGAASGALLRALVLLGDAFGLWLYNKDLREAAGVGKPARTTTTTRTDTRADGNLGPRPSAKQQTYLNKAGVDWETMQFTDWKAALDAYFANSKKAPVTDDIPF